MSEQLLDLLKLCLLALVYLFFLRVIRAVWVEVRAPAMAAAPPPAPVASTRRGRRAGREERAAGPSLVVLEPPASRGQTFALDRELTIGRAPGCAIVVDDTFVSQLHARVFVLDGEFMVEDLGSTNGSFLNRQKVGGPEPMRPGDLLQVGNTVMELR